MRRRLSLAITTLIITIVLASLAPGPAAITAQADTTIAVIDSAFQPASLSIPAGATITWTIQGSAQHTITSDDGLWDSGPLSSQPFAYTFATPGSYAYHCAIHPQAMRGTITVAAPSYLPLIIKPGAVIEPTATATATAQPTATATATAQPTAMATATTQPVRGFRGSVLVRPRWAIPPSSQPPIEYEIILDVGGSMSWNFAGQGGSVSQPIPCADPRTNCATPWEIVGERRIYIVKQALKYLIDRIEPDDVMRITGFAGDLVQNFDNQRAIDLLTITLPSSGWSSDKTVLKSAVDAVGANNGDPYLTNGRASSATGLAAAAQVIATAPITSPTTGQAYHRTVIFLTDSVANVFLDGQYNSALDICPNDPFVPVEPACQAGVTADGRLRPISAMIDRAGALKQAAVVYVVALADVDTTGLRDVASAPSAPFFTTSTSGNDLSAIMDDITTDIANGDCMPGGGYQWVDQIDARHTPSFPPPDTLPDGVFGYVYLYDENGTPLPAGQNTLPIVHDPLIGTLTFELPESQGLAPGVYMLSAYSGYKGEDGVSRVYNSLYNPSTALSDMSRAFVFDPASALGPVIPLDPVYLDLQGQVCP